jgi:hypothetical protein
LYATGADIPAALEHLEKRKRALIEDLRDADELENFEIPRPSFVNLSGSTDLTRLGVKTDLTQFAIKTLFVACVIALAVGIPGAIFIGKAESLVARTIVIAQAERQKISEQLSEKLHQYSKVAGAIFKEQIIAGLNRAAAPRPEEKKQEWLRITRAIVNEWRPVVTEAGTIFTPPKEAGTIVTPPNEAGTIITRPKKGR